MAGRAKSGKRSSGFAVRRWLSVGAAGVGLGVAAWSGSGVAAADTGGAGSNTGAAASSDSASTSKTPGVSSRGHSARSRVKAGASPDTASPARDSDLTSAVPRSAAAVAAPAVPEATPRSTSRTPVAPSAAPPSAGAAETPIAGSTISSAQAVSESADSEPVDGPPSDYGYTSVQTPSIKERIDAAIYGVLDAVSNCLSQLPSNPLTDFLQGAWLTLRRTFFNQAPTLAPSQTTGQLSGTITGTLGAVDPEDDPMMFAVLQNPVEGTVNLNPDGTFTYTPGSDFDGRDVFIVAARDTNAPALNVLDLFGNGITQALVIVEQGTTPQVDYTITWVQTRYPTGRVQTWSDEAKFGFLWAAYYLADQIIPLEDMTLTITATAEYRTGDRADTLATASSPMSGTGSGFFPTVVQSRIINGTPSVTKDGKPVPDGTVSVNFNTKWGYYGVVGDEQYDYESVMLHELMHAYGFLSDLRAPGKNGGDQRWFTFDKFVTNSSGIPGINPTTYVWDPQFDPNLVGENEGLYFFGPNEEQAFDGDPVPLYTPGVFSDESSVSHLDDNYFNNKTDPNNPRYIQLMNAQDTAGIKAPNYLSAIEKGILEDLGYTLA